MPPPMTTPSQQGRADGPPTEAVVNTALDPDMKIKKNY